MCETLTDSKGGKREGFPGVRPKHYDHPLVVGCSTGQTSFLSLFSHQNTFMCLISLITQDVSVSIQNWTSGVTSLSTHLSLHFFLFQLNQRYAREVHNT